MKLLWDAIGTEFGARHELYEMNYAGNYELIRLFPYQLAQGNGQAKQMTDFAEQCMADYDETGWRDPDYINGGDGSALDRS
jgi:4-hydroxyphenylacetate 3-monooxygenase